MPPAVWQGAFLLRALLRQHHGRTGWRQARAGAKRV